MLARQWLITCRYLLNTKQSKGLRELKVDHCYITGKDVDFLLQSMTDEPGKARDLHLDVSENYIEKDLRKLTKVIAAGYAPAHLTIRLLEFEEETDFRTMILGLFFELQQPNREVRWSVASRNDLGELSQIFLYIVFTYVQV